MAFKAPCVRTQNRDSPLELLCTHMGAPTLPSGAVINVCPQMKLNSQLFFLFRPQPLIWFLMACQTPTCLSTCRSPSGQSLLMASSSTTVWQKKPGISCRSHSLEGCQSSGKLYINHSLVHYRLKTLKIRQPTLVASYYNLYGSSELSLGSQLSSDISASLKKSSSSWGYLSLNFPQSSQWPDVRLISLQLGESQAKLPLQHFLESTPIGYNDHLLMIRGSNPLFCRFDCGSGQALIRGGDPLEMGKWHTVRYVANCSIW